MKYPVLSENNTISKPSIPHHKRCTMYASTTLATIFAEMDPHVSPPLDPTQKLNRT